jgi:hypothetical protein
VKVVADVDGEEWTMFGPPPGTTSAGMTSDPAGLLADLKAQGVDLGDPDDLRIVSMTVTQK